MSRFRPWPSALALAAAAVLVAAAPASALKTCGSAGQPVCSEDPAPNVELRLSEAENPYGLQPLSTTPSADAPLWARVRGNIPYGFNAVSAGVDGTTVDDEALLHQEIGGSVARVGADWAMIQYYPNSAAGGQSWNYEAYLDPIYKAHIRRGIRPMLMLVRTPRRFTSAAQTAPNSYVRGCETSDACWRAPRADALGRLKTFAADLAKRYPLAAGVELWNEPNLSNPFWGGEAPNPEHYASMLATASQAIKKVRRKMPVLGGSLGNVGTTTTDEWGYQRMSTRTFLARMLRAGAASSMDAVSYHPYLGPYPTWTTDRAVQNDHLYRMMALAAAHVEGAYADAGVAIHERVIASEVGASTTDGYTPEQQRDWMVMHYHLLNIAHPNLPLSSRTDAFIVHQAVEDPTPYSGLSWQIGFGLVTVKDAEGRFATKPAFCGFRTTFGGFADCPATIQSAA